MRGTPKKKEKRCALEIHIKAQQGGKKAKQSEVRKYKVVERLTCPSKMCLQFKLKK